MKSENVTNVSQLRTRCVITPLWTGRRTIAIFEAHSAAAPGTDWAADHLHPPRVELLADDAPTLFTREAA
jgi:hypothetical protein